MNTLERLATILELLNKTGKAVGKTFLQKGIYILQEGLKVNLGYKYRLYLYGPFSQELANDIDYLHDVGLISIDYNPQGYGYQIKITGAGKNFLSNLRNLESDEDVKKVVKVLSLIGEKNVREMELFGTVLYFAKLTDDDSEIKRLMRTVKPHFHDNEIEKALEKLREEGIA